MTKLTWNLTPSVAEVAALLTTGVVVDVNAENTSELEITYADGTVLRVVPEEGEVYSDERTVDPAYIGYTIGRPSVERAA